MSDYDSPWKEALDVFFEAFLNLFFPAAHADIDWSRGCESLDKELRQVVRDAEIGRRFVDKLVKVWLRNGDEQWILIHVEVQTSEDPKFAWRMYVYNYRLFDLYNREVASFAVLGDDNPRWRPDRFGYNRWGVKAGIEFPIVKLLDYADRRRELNVSENPFATVILAHLDTLETRNDQHDRKERKFLLFTQLQKRGWGEKRIRQLLRLIDWMMDLPKPLEIAFLHQIEQYKKEKHMPYVTSLERFERSEAINEGITQGITQGIAVALNVKFGKSALLLMPEIQAITDRDKLESILEAIESAASPEALRRLWSE